jgi:hypothetical protein
MISKIPLPENLIKNIHANISIGVPVTVQEEAAGLLENPIHLLDPLLAPANIVLNAARPSIFKRPDFPFIPPDDLIVAIAKERWVKINQIDRFAFQRFHDVQIVTQDEAVDR